MKPIAIVTPWFGADLTGGAEQQARQIATRLAARKHQVVVLTTCNGSFHDNWSINQYQPGATSDGGVTVRRFPVEARDEIAFDQVNAKLLTIERSSLRPGVNPVTADEANTFVHENIKSAQLLAHLGAERDAYHAFIFLPYMFEPAVLGAPLVSDRAWLQPCLHDEPAAYLPQIAAMFRRVRGLLFNSSGELELALRLFGPGIYNRSRVVGEGIEPVPDGANHEENILPAELQKTRFVLYLGRRDPTKNTDLLVRAFAQFKAAHPQTDLQLVLAGAGNDSFAAPDVHDLGLVSTEVRDVLLKRCVALAQPSHHESFSRVIMEAWSCGRPVLAQRDCLATATAVREAGGGWLAENENEWAQLFARIAEASEKELAELGAKGRAYGAEVADWEKVIPRYEALLDLKTQSRQPKSELQPRKRAANESRRAIHQLLPDIAYGDAVSNHARAIRDHLRTQGYESEIFCKRREPRMTSEASLLDEVQPEPTDVLLYHHSIGSPVTAFAIAHQAPKCLVYHNVTPAEFYAPYRPGFAWMLETGRAHLSRLARHFSNSVGVSAYNAAELRACGFREPGVLPLIIDPGAWNRAADDALIARLQNGHTNILFVGRVAPNKRHEELVETFARYHQIDPNSRLIIVGEARASDPYANHLRSAVAVLGLAEHVEITGQVDDAALLAYYRTAHLYLSLSEHEGFGAPLVEAMWFDVPVLARAAAAVPETLEKSGVLFDNRERPEAIAARAYQLVHDEDERHAVIAEQRRRRVAFTSTVVSSSLDRLIDKLTKPKGFVGSQFLTERPKAN